MIPCVVSCRRRLSGLTSLAISLPSLLVLLCAPLSASALGFPLPADGEDVVGDVTRIRTKYEDTLFDVAQRYDLGYRDVVDANPTVDDLLPGEGTEVILATQFILPPRPWRGIIINLAEMRLYYFPPGDRRVLTFPLGIGREGWSTPTGETKIDGKKYMPTWTPPESIRAEHAAMGDILPAVVPAGPDNPMGLHAFYLALPGYRIHGTNEPRGVGMRSSHGCLRLYNKDVEELFYQVDPGMPVRIVNIPYKTGWKNGELYVEAHAPLEEQLRNIEALEPVTEVVLDAIAKGGRNVEPDWDHIKEAAHDLTGVPMPVSRKAFNSVDIF